MQTERLLMFSIIIPVYKSYTLLKRCLNSLVQQNPRLFEVIIVDDTPPKYRQIIDLKEYRFSHKVVANYKNRGVTFSRNRGYFLARNKYCVFLDSDDTLTPNSLSYLLEMIDLHKPQIILSRCSDIYGNIVGSRMDSTISNSVSVLVDTYGKGERLVVVKKCSYKPFISSLRGHEFAGLLRYIDRNSASNVISVDLNKVTRCYHDDNINSISAGKYLHSRFKLIMKGHLVSVIYLCKFGRYFNSLKFFLRYLIYFFRIRS
ncbi:hypothetical protein EOPP23_15140 [Endozoicomonas sp. OPT23]|uniref:glycosyltransferase family A protein n=1 Tax=Endozoicomonas sp. OPT23 TaxID=2072845 RepID=UPI00129AA275|nr:hypothetical protein [Endozoicomonas sp. OPT23]